MSTKKQQDQDREHDAATAAFELVRPGLATEDRGDVGELRPENLGEQMARIAAGEDSSASSAEIKRAKLQLPSWRRQEDVLRGFEALGNLTAACEAAGVARRTADHWRLKDSLGFAGRLEDARAGFGDRLESLAWDMVKRMKPGQNPTLLICLLNATLPLKYRPAVQVDPVTARDTLSELRQLASSGAAAEDQTVDQGAAAVAEAERLLGTRAGPGPGAHGESGKNGTGADHQDQRDQRDRDPGPDGQELDPSGGG
jgi:hypothetical protein